MKIHYTGRNAEINDKQKAKLQAKFDKIHRILRPKDSLEAHVILSRQRHLCEAEVTLHALQHTLVVSSTGADAFTALTQALDKLSKQAVRNKHKLIDGRRPERQRGELPPAVEAALHGAAGEPAEPETEPEEPAGPRVIRSRQVVPKPMTVEEAVWMLEDSGRDQVTYRDAESGELRVLLRRRDGALELVEAR